MEEVHFKSEVSKLIGYIQILIDSANEEDYFDLQDLKVINSEYDLLEKQGNFWVERDNYPRFIYDLKYFIKWLCDFIEESGNSKWGD